MRDVEQRRRRRGIGVPQIVVNRLEVPDVLAGLCLDRDDRVPVEVRARPVAPVVARNRRGERQVDEAALGVGREEERPRVGTQPALPAIARPRVVPDVVRLGHRVEFPQARSIAHVEGAGVSDAAEGAGRGIGADHGDVAEDERHGVVGDAEADRAVVAEAGRGLAGGRLQRMQLETGGEQDARLVLVIARPVGDAPAGRRPAGHRTAPDLLARLGTQRDHAIRRRQVHHAVDHDRRRLRVRSAPGGVRLGAPQVVGPGSTQAGHVVRGDGGERGVPGSCQVAAVHRPVGAARIRRLGRRTGRQAEGQQRTRTEDDQRSPGRGYGRSAIARLPRRNHESHGCSRPPPDVDHRRRFRCAAVRRTRRGRQRAGAHRDARSRRSLRPRGRRGGVGNLDGSRDRAERLPSHLRRSASPV